MQPKLKYIYSSVNGESSPSAGFGPSLSKQSPGGNCKKFRLMEAESGTQVAAFLSVYYSIHNLCWKPARPGR